LPATQSLSVAHAARHAVVPQTYGAQFFVGCGHAPLPSHVDISVSVPLVHFGAPHDVFVGALLQTVVSTPLQLRPHVGSVGVELHAPWLARGCPTTGTHVPAFPGSPHASHLPAHAVAQQTPSMQKPDAHSVAFAHAAPGVFAQ
jgi:hypothetical protein